MASPLDDLARALTSPISRRRALRLTAAATVTSFFGPRIAAAAPGDCPTCPRESDPPDFTQLCGGSRPLGCLFVCCPSTFTCCQTEAGVVCCREGYGCGPVVDNYPSCKCMNECGGACCKPDEKCSNPDTGLCCKIPCGDTCCRSGEKCVEPSTGTCCKSTEKACIGPRETICCDEFAKCCVGTTGFRVTQCCGFGQTCTDDGSCVCGSARPVDCHGDQCCGKTDKCCQSPTGRGFCAPKDWRCCGDGAAGPGESCCAGRFPYFPSAQRCCGLSGICPIDAECCVDGCCPEGSSCCIHGCCNAAGARVAAKQPFMRPRPRRGRHLFVDRRRVIRRHARRSTGRR